LLLQWGSDIFIPIEKTLKPKASLNKIKNDIHICVQGVVWIDDVYGPMPAEHFQTFIGFYAAFGVSNIHIYTNSFIGIESWLLHSRMPKSTRVWFHDSPFPPKNHNNSYFFDFDVLNRGLQFYSMNFFVMNDCVARAKSMGASYVFLIGRFFLSLFSPLYFLPAYY